VTQAASTSKVHLSVRVTLDSTEMVSTALILMNAQRVPTIAADWPHVKTPRADFPASVMTDILAAGNFAKILTNAVSPRVR
jgi:hypothetical protein